MFCFARFPDLSQLWLNFRQILAMFYLAHCAVNHSQDLSVAFAKRRSMNAWNIEENVDGHQVFTKMHSAILHSFSN